MSALTGSSINTTYQGLIKTTDNAAISGTPKALEDGAGNTLPVQVGTSSMVYSGTQDFTGATVVGIGGGGGTPSYSESWVTRGAYTSAEDIVYFNSSVYPIWLEEGMNLQTFSAYVGPTGAPAGMTMDFALFSSQRFATPSVSRMLVPNQNLYQIGTSIPFTTPGQVEVTGLSYTVPHSGVYFVHFRSSGTGWWGGRAALALGDGNANWQQINANNIFNQNASVAGRYWVGEGSVPSSYSNSFSWNDAGPNLFFFFKYN